MTRQQTLDHLKSQRASFLLFLRDETPLTTKDTLKLCLEVSRLSRRIESLESIHKYSIDQEYGFYTYEMESALNLDAKKPEPKRTKRKARRTTRKMPVIPSTWNRQL